MLGSQEELRSIGPLLAEGRLEELLSLVLKLWPPDALWDGQDVEYLTMLLHVLSQRHPSRTAPLYAPYTERLKRHGDDIWWLQTLSMRARVVADFEGEEAAMAWLNELSNQITPPNNGLAHVLVARLLLDRGRADEAVKELRRALPLALSSMGLYNLEAIQEMMRCQVMLGDSQLAFEYAKAHAIETYKMGQLSGEDLVKACKGHANWLGQVDYLIDLQTNVAELSRQASNYSWAAIAESEAAVTLARIGVDSEACRRMRAAAEDAARGRHPNDPLYSSLCLLLARLYNPAPLTAEEVAGQLSDYAKRWSPRALRPLIKDTVRCVREGRSPEAALADRWRAACARVALEQPSSERMRIEILIHLAALLARHYAEVGDGTSSHCDAAAAFYALVVESATARSAVSSFARERLAEHLLRDSKSEEAMKLCEPELRAGPGEPCGRFLLRQMAARCSLQSDRQAAYLYAAAALSDWRRVLEGVYVEEHKVAWLRKGEECLRCAIEALSRPADWMEEGMRRRELFRLMELGKARVVSDMINRRGYVPRPYVLSAHSADELISFDEDEQDWNIPLILQAPVYSDLLTNVSYDDRGNPLGTQEISLAPLRCAIIRPMSQEKRLLTTALSLAYESSDEPAPPELYRDFLAMVRDGREA